MMAASGLLPQLGDVVRIDHRAVPELPAGADLLVKVVEPARSITGWTYLTVQIIANGTDAPWRRVLVPVASVTIYPDGTA